MGRVIVTKTKVSKTPYCMKESGHPLFSYEELCYYIGSRTALWLEEKKRPGLTDKLKEWGIEITEIDSLPPVEAAECILNAGVYFDKEEKEQLLSYLGSFQEKKEILRKKETADLYLIYGRSKKAYLSYWKAAGLVTGEESADFLASLYHNLGISCCKFFYWEEAKTCFSDSLKAKETKEAAQGLEFASSMEKKTWKQGMISVEKESLKMMRQTFLYEIS